MANAKYAHWTEFDARVRKFVAIEFGAKARKRDHGADLQVGDLRVEVKAAQEWCVTNCASGKRRRGRFQLHGWEQAEFFLFVLVRKSGLSFQTMKAGDVRRRFGKHASVRWNQVFVE